MLLLVVVVVFRLFKTLSLLVSVCVSFDSSRD